MVSIYYESSILSRAQELVRHYMPHGELAMVVDRNTHAALGEALLRAFAGTSVRVIHLGDKADASLNLSYAIQQQMKGCDGALAVGSGTINDLTKHASFTLGIPYVVFPTAPSMNGYVSPGASLQEGRAKTSLAAHQPLAALCDMQVLCAAPHRMIRAGLGDMLCRSTVQADMLLSHYLLGTPYDETLFSTLRPLETEMLKHADGLLERDSGVVKLLMQMIFASGEAMARAKSSAPASQSEHMIAHTMDLLYSAYNHDRLHGEQIAVTTVFMARAQEKLMLGQPLIRPTRRSSKRFDMMFGQELGRKLHKHYMRKAISAEMAERLNDTLDREWKDIKAHIESVMVTATRLRIALRKGGAPTHYTELRWDEHQFENAVMNAYLTRDRFTFLDIAAMDPSLRIVVD